MHKRNHPVWKWCFNYKTGWGMWYFQ